MGEVPVEYRSLLGEYCSAMKKHFGERLKSICVFGSVAKGRATPESDVDVLTVVDGLPKDVGQRVRDAAQVHEELRKTQAYKSLRALKKSGLISDILLTPEEAGQHPPILLDITDEGIILYDDGGFLARVLESVRKRLRELGARKVITAKGHYWILKPDLKPGEVVKI